jgi:serine/threonine-protein kinase
MYQICHVTPALVSRADPSVPTLLDPVLAKALAKDPSARFQTAKDFCAAVVAARIALGLTVAQTVSLPTAAAATLTNPPEARSETPATAVQRARFSDAVKVPPLDRVARIDTDYCAPAGWSTEQLAEIEQQLAPIIGPVARIVVKRAAALTSDRNRLFEELCGQLNSEERERFLRGASFFTAAESVPSMLSATGADGGISSGEIPAASCGRTTQILARYIGPIAAVLVKKFAPLARDEADLYARLAERVTDVKERERFIAEVTRSS